MNIFLFSVSFHEETKLVGTLCYRFSLKFEWNLSLLQYCHFVCWVKNFDQFPKKYRCERCDKFFPRASNYQRHLTNCSHRISHRYPTGPYHSKETVFEKLINLDIPEPDFFVSKHYGTLVPISVSFFSNLISEPIFNCNSEPRLLVRLLIEELVILSRSSSQQMLLTRKNQMNIVSTPS